LRSAASVGFEIVTEMVDAVPSTAERLFTSIAGAPGSTANCTGWVTTTG